MLYWRLSFLIGLEIIATLCNQKAAVQVDVHIIINKVLLFLILCAEIYLIKNYQIEMFALIMLQFITEIITICFALNGMILRRI